MREDLDSRVLIFITSLLWLTVVVGLYKEDFKQIFKWVSFAVRATVGIPQTSLVKPVWRLSLLKLTVLSQSAICVLIILKHLIFCVVTFLFKFSVGIGGFVIGLSQISSFLCYNITFR